MYVQDQTITALPLLPAEYEGCTFQRLDLSGQDLSACKFLECRFEHCQLSNAKLNGSAWRTVHFQDCKLQGLHFEYVNTFLLALSFAHCDLSYSSFHGLNLKKTHWSNCRLWEVDFSHAQLQGAQWQACDFLGALFEESHLEDSDFSNSYQFIISPKLNHLKGAKIPREGLEGLIQDLGITLL